MDMSFKIIIICCDNTTATAANKVTNVKNETHAQIEFID